MTWANPGPISAATRYCAVFGDPIRHSASPAMHNAGLAALGLDWRYLAFHVVPQDLKPALDGARRMGFLGLNLTVPHKQSAVALMDALEESARNWGAVNTVRFEVQGPDGGWYPCGQHPELRGPVRAHGFNTDGDGLVESLREDLGWHPAGGSMLLIGAGGAGRVAALKLAAEGLRSLWLVNRTESKSGELRAELAAGFPQTAVHLGYPDGDVDLMVNASSLGLRPDDSLPVDLSRFALTRARRVYDMVYRPAETALLREARKAGCRAANGLGMLLHQGTRALTLWTGRPAPAEAMREALRTSLGQ